MKKHSLYYSIICLGGMCWFGSAYSADGRVPPVGKDTPSTQPFSGSISPVGAIEDNRTGTIIGEINRNGIIYNNNGQIVGSVEDNGTVKDSRGNVVARVPPGKRLIGIGKLLGH